MNQNGNAPTLIRTSKINKWYGNFHALKDVDLSVTEGEKKVVCGPSGSGKSTLIRSINLLEPFQEGEIEVCGVQVRPGEVTRRMSREIHSQVGMVFQQFNLFPHLTVIENLVVGPVWGRGEDRKQVLRRAMEILDRVHMGGFAHKYPAELSGGQQQRVAIARALCLRPRAILFDEPTASLDPEMVNEVLDVMETLARDGMTMIIVTHEMGFARRIADEIVFMNEGQIVEVARPNDFFGQPKSERLKIFLSQILSH
ncbi:MAG: amino acid ABC transporter ATP-binding protein [Xanthobacteraceae bacterium]